MKKTVTIHSGAFNNKQTMNWYIQMFKKLGYNVKIN